MSASSAIEWTDATWNPVRGCTKVSPGCKHCYAKTFAERFVGVKEHPYKKGFEVRLVPEKLAEPLRWSKPQMIFVNSMSDLFHPTIPDWYLSRVVRVMATANWHTYQVLTKRAERMSHLLAGPLAEFARLEHIWWGVSVENRQQGLPRIARIQAAPVATRFLSVEPLLEDLGSIDLSGIHWVIVGGESGPGARALMPDWVRSIQRQCHQHDVKFFFKQWGGVQKKKSGRILDGQTYDDFPPIVRQPVPAKSIRKEHLLSCCTESTIPLIGISL